MCKRLSLLIFLSAVLLLSVQSVNAQEMICQEELSEANALYTNGRFDESIERIDVCLAKENISVAERRTAYRLKGLCFIGKGAEVDAKGAVQYLLELFPNYQPDPVQDPPDFVMMVNEMKEEINSDLASQQNENVVDENENPTVEEVPPVTDSTPEPVAQVAKKKKKGAGRFVLIGAGAAAAGGVVYWLINRPTDDPVVISGPPPLPN